AEGWRSDQSATVDAPGEMAPGGYVTLAKGVLFRHLCFPASHSATAGLPLRLVLGSFEAPKRVSNESYRRACRTFEVAGPRPPRGRTAQYHSNSGERAGESRSRQTQPQGDRSGSRSHRFDSG